MLLIQKRHDVSDYMVATRPGEMKEFHFESGKIWKSFEQQADVGVLKKSILFAHYIKELSIHLHYMWLAKSSV